MWFTAGFDKHLFGYDDKDREKKVKKKKKTHNNNNNVVLQQTNPLPVAMSNHTGASLNPGSSVADLAPS